MSFIQQENSKRFASMGTALALNGSIILAIILSPLVARPKPPHVDTDVFFIPQPITPVVPQTRDTADDQPKIEPIYTPEAQRDTADDPENTMTTTREDLGGETGIGGTVETGKGGGEGSETVREIITDPPLAPLVHALRDPRYARNFQPDYPAGLLAKEIEGDAVLKVLVGTDGRVREAIVVRASHPDFGKAAVKAALKSWRFVPATRGGVPVEDWQSLPIRFTIDS